MENINNKENGKKLGHTDPQPNHGNDGSHGHNGNNNNNNNGKKLGHTDPQPGHGNDGNHGHKGRDRKPGTSHAIAFENNEYNW